MSATPRERCQLSSEMMCSILTRDFPRDFLNSSAEKLKYNIWYDL